VKRKGKNKYGVLRIELKVESGKLKERAKASTERKKQARGLR
jgi:hypothetical protein